MPYSGINDPDLPSHVQDMSADQRRQWIAVFEEVLARTGDEGQAMAQANATAKSWARDVVKSLGDRRIGGYLVVWGDAEHTDLEGDYFTPQTNFWLNTYQNQPTLFNHAMGILPDGVSADLPVKFQFGNIVKVSPDDVGLWIEAQINDHNEWVEAVLELIEKGVLHWSSGSVPHLIKRHDDGWLESWPIVEASTTATPAEPRKTGVVRVKKYLVNDQAESDPEATPEQGARRSDMPDNVLDRLDMEEQTMTLMLSPETVKALVRAYAETNAADLADAISAVETKQGEGAITDMLRPLAEELAQMAGADVEETLGYLVQFVAEKATGAPEPEAEEPEPVMEEMMSTEPEMLSINREDLQAMLDEAAQKAIASKDTGAGFYRAKNVGQLGRAEKPLTLGSYIKAVRDRDYAYLNKYHARIKAEHKALGINPDTAGGYLVPTEQSNQIIELLRSKSVVLPLCQQFPMNRSDTMTVPMLTGGAQAYWIGENSQITAADATFGQRMLVAKKMGILMKISNELIEDSDPAVDAIIRNDMAREAAGEIDNVILEGTGVGSEPLGLANVADITKTALNAACTFANLNDAVYRVEAENVDADPTWAWVINPREKKSWRELEDTSGNLVWIGSQAPGNIGQSNPPTMLEYPVYTTTEITIDTDNNNETRVYFGQWNDVVVGMRKSLEIRASDEAGDAFEYDQTWIRAILRMDVVVRHDESIEILTDVRDA